MHERVARVYPVFRDGFDKDQPDCRKLSNGGRNQKLLSKFCDRMGADKHPQYNITLPLINGDVQHTQ